ncbi:hypothetical protein BD410DRAFT_895622 [Rickenella mellea]|uniref:Uncharacterized protein n=1 Tax=Rickenella mellea TaxID=50990 RepID=A0A4Y7QH70_9AGAM|nr:hypothetical protein BD410DRAFT_895622 [Rickenella mellea]
MPQHRGHRPTAGLKSHHRVASGGSAKGLNLQLTQKDPHAAKVQDKLKKSGHSATDLHAPRTASPHLRPTPANGTTRAPAKENVHGQQKRAQTPIASKRAAAATSAATRKVDFTLAGSAGTEEDEWVSSESGAVTPVNDQDVQVLEVSPRRSDDSGDHVSGTTPRAESAMPRVDTARPSHPQQQQGFAYRKPVVAPNPPHVTQPTPPPQPRETFLGNNSAVLAPPSPTAARMAHSEAPSPSHANRHLPKRQTLSRQSTYSDSKAETPHHPLIRGQSYHGAMKPSPLAPLTVQAQISTSPPSLRSAPLSSSPTTMTSSMSNYMDEAHPGRRTSMSSARSVATLPVPSSPNDRRAIHDRTRTLSSVSRSSSSAALSSLTALPAMSRPGTPPLTVRFPPEHINFSAADTYHNLLPPPYIATHLTVLAHSSPLRQSYDRVMRARQRR